MSGALVLGSRCDARAKAMVTKAMVTKAMVTEAMVTKAMVTKAMVTKAMVTKAMVTKAMVTKAMVLGSRCDARAYVGDGTGERNTHDTPPHPDARRH